VALGESEPPGAPGGGGGGPEGEEVSGDDRRGLVFLRLRAQDWLDEIDENGGWTVLSALLAFGTFLLETLNEEKFGGWDVLFRDDLPLSYGFSMTTISYLEGVTNVAFAAEYLLRAWIAGFSIPFFTSPFNLVDLLSALPPFLALAGADGRTLRLFRVARVLRLLRLLDRAPNSVLFGVLQSDDSGLQLVGVAAEFVCIFCCAAGVIFDLELGANPNVHNLSDTLYWAFLTLTGIGQPFEIVTPAGKVATVIAVLVALVVIPGQLAKLATVSMSNNVSVMEYMTDEEREVFIASGGKVASRTAAAAAEASARRRGTTAASIQAAQAAATYSGGNLMRSASAQALAQLPRRAPSVTPPAPLEVAPGGAAKPSPQRRFRRTLVARRGCGGCGEAMHDMDAQFCKVCGGRLGGLLEEDSEEA